MCPGRRYRRYRYETGHTLHVQICTRMLDVERRCVQHSTACTLVGRVVLVIKGAVGTRADVAGPMSKNVG